MTTAPTTEPTQTRIHRVTGAGGLQLRVDETGNPAGRPVLFLHGVSQNRLAWRKQLHSDLADDHRLLAMDLRGHGASDRAADAYKDSAAWAQDVNAVIKSLNLERPILSGWSYGGVVICDYLRHFGQDAVGGIHLINATTRLGEPALPFLGPRFVSLIPGLCSPDVEESTSTLEAFMMTLTREKLSPEDFYLFLGSNTVVAPRGPSRPPEPDRRQRRPAHPARHAGAGHPRAGRRSRAPIDGRAPRTRHPARAGLLLRRRGTRNILGRPRPIQRRAAGIRRLVVT